MKIIMLGAFCIGAMGFALSVHADDFGSRFQEEAPVALADNTYSLQDIEPAAGDDKAVMEGAYQAIENTAEGHPRQYTGHNYTAPDTER